MKPLQDLIAASQRYGANPEMVLAGGGNTSYKDDEVMYVKASGHKLASIDEQGFVRMQMAALGEIWEKTYAEETREREAQVLADLMAARCEGETARPSVEALLHSLIRFPFVIHMHPGLVNGLTCARDGASIMKEIWGDQAVWIPLVNPGYVLALTVKEALEQHESKTGVYPPLIFLQNHGIFVSADSVEQIDALYADVMGQLRSRLKREPDFTALPIDAERSGIVLEAFSSDAPVVSCLNVELQRYLESERAFGPLESAYTPDHIVYSGFKPAWIAEIVFDTPSPVPVVRRCVENFDEKNGVRPKILAIQKTGIFASSQVAMDLFLNTVLIAIYAESFGGFLFMTEDQIDFIRNWEVEQYRAQVSAS